MWHIWGIVWYDQLCELFSCVLDSLIVHSKLSLVMASKHWWTFPHYHKKCVTLVFVRFAARTHRHHILSCWGDLCFIVCFFVRSGKYSLQKVNRVTPFSVTLLCNYVKWEWNKFNVCLPKAACDMEASTDLQQHKNYEKRGKKCGRSRSTWIVA